MGSVVACGGSGGEVTEEEYEKRREAVLTQDEEKPKEDLPTEVVSSDACGLSVSWEAPTCQIVTIKVGYRPQDVIYDGTHLWVVNMGDNYALGCSSLSKIDPVTTQLIDTFSLGCRKSSRSLAFDGTHLWVANAAGALCGTDPQCAELGTVSKFDINLNKVIATVRFGKPWNILAVGDDIWVSNGLLNISSIFKIDTATNLPDGTVTLPETSFEPTLGFDGNHLWVGDASPPSEGGHISKINVETMKVVKTFKSPGITSMTPVTPYGLIFITSKSRCLPLTDPPGQTGRIDSSGPAVVVDVLLGKCLTDITFDGTHIWVASTSEIYQIDPTTENSRLTVRAVEAASYTNISSNYGYTSITNDGNHIWVTNENEHTLTRFPLQVQ